MIAQRVRSRRWLLSGEERAALKKLDRLNVALDLTHEHICDLHDKYNTEQSLAEAYRRADGIIAAMREVVAADSVSEDRK